MNNSTNTPVGTPSKDALAELNRGLLRTIMSPEAAGIVADRLEEMEAETLAQQQRIRELEGALRGICDHELYGTASVMHLQSLIYQARALLPQ